MLKNQLISFETAKLAKEKGFDLNVEFYYKNEVVKNVGNITRDFNYSSIISANHNKRKEAHHITTQGNKIYRFYSAPTQSLLQKWLREKFSLSIKIDDFVTDSKIKFDFNVSILGSQDDNPQGIFDTYEEALEAGLIYALNKI